MSRMQFLGVAAAITVLSIFSATAAAQCTSSDLEDFAAGTIFTTHLDGVTFYVVGQTCGGSPFLYNRIADEFYGDSFSSNVLLIDTGCPDFSDDYMRMIFDDRQGDVRFTLGPWAGTYFVRAYTAPVGGAPVDSQTIVIPGTGFVGVHHPVQVTRAERNIRRIEIEAAASGHEAIDHLSFGQDDTPPEVRIDYPAPLECIEGEITMTGIVCEDDGAYDRDRLEYMRTWPNPQTDWTLVREYVGQTVCDPFPLYAWDTAVPEVIDGIYVLRVTAINACGLTATKEMTVQVNNEFDSVDLRSPATGSIVGGSVCFDGTAWERTCFDNYVVKYRPAGGGSWLPVDSTNPVYASTVTNDPLAWWADAQSLPDGDYFVALAGYTTGGASASDQITLTLDNTPPTAEITSPGPCANLEGVVHVTGTAFDTHIDDWSLYYFSPITKTWKYIDDDSDNVIAGALGDWDTSGLAPCFYLLRLRVKDLAVVDRCTDPDPHVTDYLLPVAVGMGGATDLDFDGDTDLADFSLFMALFTGPLP
ncbi:MAG: hypothetical protein GY778_05300 [bacterium]|nr:hypothetical protein [bacterium]